MSDSATDAGTGSADLAKWQRMVEACAEDDRRLLESLRETDWQKTRGDEVAGVLDLAAAFPSRAVTDLEYPLLPRK